MAMADLDGLRLSEEKKTFIRTLHPLLEEMVADTLSAMPSDPGTRMRSFLLKKKGVVQDDSALTAENAKLREEIKAMTAKVTETGRVLGQLEGAAGAAAGPDAGSAEESEEDDDVVDEIPKAVQMSATRSKARASVSAEAYGAWNQQKAFTPPVHFKSEEQKQRLTRVLSSSFLFNSLGGEELEKVLLAMKEEYVDANVRLIHQGDDGDFLFVIESGSLECKIKQPDGSEAMVKRVGAGDVFGELAVLYSQPRAASVDATERCVLWRLDRETFNHIVKGAAQQKRERYQGFLSSVPLLKNSKLSAYETAQIADALAEETVPAGTQIIKEGDEGASFYILESGEAFATVAAKGATPVMEYSSGGFFGELALLRNMPRAATVTAKTECKLLKLDRASFNRLLGNLGEMLQREYS